MGKNREFTVVEDDIVTKWACAEWTDPASRTVDIFERYLGAVKYGMPELTLAEWVAMTSALNSSVRNATLTANLEAQIEDSLQHEALEEQVDGLKGAALLAKLKGMPYSSRLAIVEVVDRWWNCFGGSSGINAAESLQKCGARIEGHDWDFKLEEKYIDWSEYDLQR